MSYSIYLSIFSSLEHVPRARIAESYGNLFFSHEKSNYFKIADIYGVKGESLMHMQSGGDQINLISVSMSCVVIYLLVVLA